MTEARHIVLIALRERYEVVLHTVRGRGLRKFPAVRGPVTKLGYLQGQFIIHGTHLRLEQKIRCHEVPQGSLT